MYPRDVGAGFLELLVSVVLLGTAGIAVLSAVGAAAFGATTHREIANAQSALSAVNDQLVTGAIAFEPCGTPTHYEALVPSEFAVGVTEVQYWETSAWSANCADSGTNTMQLVTLVADSANRGDIERQVVIRQPSDPDADYIVNQGSGSGNGAPIIPVAPTPGIDGTTTTVTATTSTTTTSVAPGSTTTTVAPGTSTTTSTTTTTTTTVPGPAPTCEVTSVDVNKHWKDTVRFSVRNDSSHVYAWTDWVVKLSYKGTGAEADGHYSSTWSDKNRVLTLTPGETWLNLSPNSSLSGRILEPPNTLNGLKAHKVGCEVVTS